MRVVRLEIRHFRGFAAARVVPGGHVLVVGEPRAGRSDLIAALTRVLDSEATRAALEEWDFHGHDVTRPIVIEVVLADLGDALSQRFLGELEFWDPTQQVLLPGSDSVEQLAATGAVPALRLAYRGQWDAEEERGEHWVYYPKISDPEADSFHKAPRVDRAALPFLAPSPGPPLALNPQGGFRRLLEVRGPEEITQALRTMASGMDELSAKFSTAPAVVDGLEAVLIFSAFSNPAHERRLTTGPSSTAPAPQPNQPPPRRGGTTEASMVGPATIARPWSAAASVELTSIG